MIKMINMHLHTLQGPGGSDSKLLGPAASLTPGNKHRHTWLQWDGFTLCWCSEQKCWVRHPVPSQAGQYRHLTGTGLQPGAFFQTILASCSDSNVLSSSFLSHKSWEEPGYEAL